MKSALLLVLLLTILVSGCLGGQKTDTPKSVGIALTKGVEITEFSTLDKVDEGETIELNLYVQNMGDAQATNLVAELYQFSGFECPSLNFICCGTGNQRLNPGWDSINDLSETCVEGKIPVVTTTCDATETCSDKCASIGVYQKAVASGSTCTCEKGCPTQARDKLVPPEKDMNMPGDTFSPYWSLQAPDVAEDQTRAILGKLYYTYTSTVSTNIQLVSKAEWDSKGGASAFNTYSTSSQAPVTLSITPVPAIRVSDKTVDEKTVSIDIVIRNTGSGVITNPYVYDFTMRFSGADGTEEMDISKGEDSPIHCTGGVVAEFDDHENVVRIFGVQQERSVRCDLDLPFSQETGYSGYLVESSVTYNYAIDTSPVNIKILKT